MQRIFDFPRCFFKCQSGAGLALRAAHSGHSLLLHMKIMSSLQFLLCNYFYCCGHLNTVSYWPTRSPAITINIRNGPSSAPAHMHIVAIARMVSAACLWGDAENATRSPITRRLFDVPSFSIQSNRLWQDKSSNDKCVSGLSDGVMARGCSTSVICICIR